MSALSWSWTGLAEAETRLFFRADGKEVRSQKLSRFKRGETLLSVVRELGSFS